MDKTLFFGILVVLATFNSVLSAPHVQSQEDADYQGDDYDYAEDTNLSSQQEGRHQTHSPSVASKGAQPFFARANESVTGVIGKDIVLKCDAQNLKENVILWYRDQVLIATGKNVLLPEYKFSKGNPNDLIIMSAMEDAEGHYSCDVEPQNIKKHFHVKVVEQPIEAIIPESSTSSPSAPRALVNQLLISALLANCILAFFSR